MKNLSWVNVLFFCGVPLVALIGGGFYIYEYGVTWTAVLLFFFMLIATLMSITAGYHRLYAHRSYEAAKWLKFLFLVFGAGAFQESCLKWASDHRAHHRHVDKDQDPYNIKRGFFWAHIGWILSTEDQHAPHSKDLLEDPLIMWQYKWWLPLSIIISFGLPTWIGALFGDALGGLIFGGFLRLTVAHHATFFINSLAHTIGSQNYSLANTAKDSWITSFFTFGEGYHNYHHWYARDYRNGIRSFDWDPGKWLIRLMSWMGQAWNLKKASEAAVIRARLETQWEKYQGAIKKGPWEPMSQLYKKMILELEELSKRKQIWLRMKQDASQKHFREKLVELRHHYKEAKKQYRETYRVWKSAIRQLKAHKTPAFAHN